MRTGDVTINPINPENPDSKPMAAARVISIGDLGRCLFSGNVACNNFESGF